MSRFITTCGISRGLRERLRSFKFSKSTSLNALILKVDRDAQQIVLEDSIEDCSIDEVRRELSQQPRFVLLSYVLRHADGRLSYPMCLVFYSLKMRSVAHSPLRELAGKQGCSPELQMMYAGSKENVVQECEVTNNFEIRDAEELTKEYLDLRLG
ncbi:hypothetical protein KIN20_006930 [Parelaphostrongylus tenuis]|uniref:ADF-H domain-containing protein n=1 Tax=Parelaphostrongylus tenuis TaxID=148309 RepID=A0AAD5QHC3_PARTN|nr:hypothetical protein KIN20_006930 [Parelaphostrongylus tenuis]